MNIAKQIAEELKIKVWQVEAVMELIDEGCTIPFIARYRKEKHGSLNDEQLRNLDERLTYLRNLEERKETVLASIEEQGKLTEELKQQILAAQTQVLLEDLYRPYRPKRRTRATIAKEKGLEGLANQILLQMLDHSVEEEAKQYLDEEKEVATVEQAISGALDILAEAIADEADYRTAIRKTTMQKGSLVSTAKNAEEKTVYENYYDFSTVLSKVSGYQTLAINRGEKEKILTVKIEAHEAGANVMIVTKLRIGDANTMMAEGGIQAADKENDSPVQHYLDCFGGGHFAAKPELVKRLVMEAPDAIKWLNDLGVEFDKEDDGTMITTHGGGTSRKRMHAAKD